MTDLLRNSKFRGLILTLMNIYIFEYANCVQQVNPSIVSGNLFNDVARLAGNLKPFHDIHPDAYSDPVSKCNTLRRAIHTNAVTNQTQNDINQPQFIRSRRFKAETHYVVTKDNYIITLHRIINPLVPQELRPLLKPVYLQHGLFTSSFNFIISSDKNRDGPRFDPQHLTRTKRPDIFEHEGPFSWNRMLNTINDLTLARLGVTDISDHYAAPNVSDSLAFELANNGYDVWMGNFRGTTYSLNHTHYDHRHDWRYWDFSFHEMGLYDIPSCIDYILNKRKRKSLAYVGHSQGTLSMFILQSLHPEWAAKVKPFVAIAPIAYLSDIFLGALRLFIKSLSPFITPKSLNRVLKGQVVPNDGSIAKALDPICVPKLTTPICDILLALILGDNLIRANQSMTPVIIHHIPEGTSALNILHYAQLVDTGEFRSFDFGRLENLRKYGSAENPYYPLGKIESPDISFIYGRKDPYATMKNVELTKSKLRVRLMDEYVVPDPFWGHGDYVYAMGAGRQVNAHIVDICDRYRLVDLDGEGVYADRYDENLLYSKIY